MPFLRLAILFFAIGLLTSSHNAALAETFDLGCDWKSLSEAVAEANSSADEDIINLTPGCGLYFEGELAFTRPGDTITINGNDTTLTGLGMGRFFSVGEAVTVTINHLGFMMGYSESNGGAIFVDGGILTVDSSVFHMSSSTSDGGAIYNQGGTVTIINSTFFDNVPGIDDGAAIANDGVMSIIHSTLTNVRGNVINYGTLTLKNSILANSQHGTDCVNDGGEILAEGVNWIQDGSCDVPDALSGDPKLSALALHGSDTIMTIPPYADSKVIDAATDCPLPDVDQRGAERPSGLACDIGAFEFQADASVTETEEATLTPTSEPADEIEAG